MASLRGPGGLALRGPGGRSLKGPTPTGKPAGTYTGANGTVSGSLGLSPSTASPGQQLTLNYQVSGAATAYVLLKTGAGYQGSATTLSGVSGGVQQVHVTLPATAATYQIVLSLDTAGTQPLWITNPIVVAAVAAAASFTASTVPSTATVGTAITGVAYSGSGIATWRPVRNGTAGATTAISAQSGTLSYTPADLVPNGTWQLSLQLLDSAGNVLADTASVHEIVVSEPAQSGGGSVATLPAAAINVPSALATGAPITFAHFFKKGDVPAGKFNNLTATIGGTTVPLQPDHTNTWLADGSLRCATLTTRLPAATSAGTTLSAQLGSSSSAISGTVLTIAQVLAHSTITVQATGHDLGSDVFTVSANDVLTNLSNDSAPSGNITNYPLGGWRPIRSGPYCVEWFCWRYLKRQSDGASHRWLKAKIYLRAWSDGQGNVLAIEPGCGLFAENCYGPHPSGAVGTSNAQPVQIQCAITIFDGATQIMSLKTQAGNDPIINQHRGVWAIQANGRRPWITKDGSTQQPIYYVAPDRYYMRSTQCIPYYDVEGFDALKASVGAAVLQMTTSTPNYTNFWLGGSEFSNTMPNGVGSIESEGDNATDTRYGFFNCNAVALFFNGVDPLRWQSVMADGYQQCDFEIWFTDERSGHALNLSNTNSLGPSVANPTFYPYINQSSGTYVSNGSPGWCGSDTSRGWDYGDTSNYGNGLTSTYHSFSYGPFIDLSHYPNMSLLQYLLTGDAIFLELMAMQAQSGWLAQDQYRNVAGQQLTLIFEGIAGERSCAHQLRNCGIASRSLPDNHPVMTLVQTSMAGSAGLAAMTPSSFPHATASIVAKGIYYSQNISDIGPQDYSGNVPFPHLFMTHDLQWFLAIEALVNEYSGWMTMINQQANLVVDLYDPANGGDSNLFNVYNFAWSDGTNVFADWATARQHANNSACIGPYASSGFYNNGNGSSGQEQFVKASILQSSALPSPPHNAVAVAKNAVARYKATWPGLASAGVFQYLDGNTGLTGNLFMQWAVGLPPSVTS